jgi:hypothetical protein
LTRGASKLDVDALPLPKSINEALTGSLYVEIMETERSHPCDMGVYGTRRDSWKVLSSGYKWAQPTGSVDSESAHLGGLNALCPVTGLPLQRAV